MRYFMIVVSLVVLLGVLAPRVQAHASLDHAAPAVGSKVETAPTDVKLWFTEQLDAKASTIKVMDSTGEQVDKKDSHLAPNNQSVLCVSLPPLQPGKYKVIWTAGSVDAHSTKGDFTFRIGK